jgi:hypothetical protein
MLRLVFVFILVIAQQGRAQSDNGASDPVVQPDESVGDFKKGKGAEPKNKHSAKVNGVKLKGPKLGGSGCPEGTVGVSITPDNKTMSIIFDNYIAQAGRSFDLKRDIKTCSVSVPLSVPAGFQFAVVKLDYRGYHLVPEKGRTNYLTIYSFTDANSGKQIGKRIRRKVAFQGPLDEEYILSSDVSSEPVWSRCGQAVNFRIDTRVVVASNGRGDDVMATIDSLDASVGNSVQYHLVWQACTPSN